RPASGPGAVDCRGRVPPAGACLARHDGPLLPQQRLALSAPGRVRPPLPLQDPPRAADLGASPGTPATSGQGGRAGTTMIRSLVDQIVDAVLYEGYLLYPYRPSALKNRQRWTFGGLVPEAYSLAQGGTEPATMQTECLVRGGSETLVRVQVRFLHLLERI